MRYIYGIFGTDTIKYTVIHGVIIRLWPTLLTSVSVVPQKVRVSGGSKKKARALTCMTAIWLRRCARHVEQVRARRAWGTKQEECT